MLNFGLGLGKVNTKSCNTLPDGEIFYNRHFECGLDYWETNAYGGILEVVDNTSVRLTATDLYSSLTQTSQFPISSGSYHLGIVVNECVGNGKFSYKLWDGTWHTPISFSSPGTYEIDITVDQDIIAFDIGADGDDTFSAVFDGISCMDASVIHFPDWWHIDSLDSSDILGAWDFNWVGIDNSETARTNLQGIMESFSIALGAPYWREGQGMYFGGGGALSSMLPDGIDINNLTVIIQISGARQNATLDALYSHFKSTTRYTLQNGWGTPALRWCCGDGTATTIGAGGTVSDGIIATSGRTVYVDGTEIGVVPESAEALTADELFILGAIILDDGRIVQNSIVTYQKVLIVGRILTEAEIQEIISNMTGSVDYITYNGEQLTYKGEPIWK